MLRTAAPAAIASVVKGMGPERRIKGLDQMLWSAMQSAASEPRAAVVKIRDALKRIGNPKIAGPSLRPPRRQERGRLPGLQDGSSASDSEPATNKERIGWGIMPCSLHSEPRRGWRWRLVFRTIYHARVCANSAYWLTTTKRLCRRVASVRRRRAAWIQYIQNTPRRCSRLGRLVLASNILWALGDPSSFIPEH
jgi:hypothetical protein